MPPSLLHLERVEPGVPPNTGFFVLDSFPSFNYFFCKKMNKSTANLEGTAGSLSTATTKRNLHEKNIFAFDSIPNSAFCIQQ